MMVFPIFIPPSHGSGMSGKEIILLIVTMLIVMPSWAFIFMLIGRWLNISDNFIDTWYGLPGVIGIVCLYMGCIMGTVFITIKLFGD